MTSLTFLSVSAEEHHPIEQEYADNSKKYTAKGDT